MRGGSRLLVLHRSSGGTEHQMFSDLPDHLRAGDLLVLNNTRVFPARLLGHRVPSGGAVECLLLGPVRPAPLPTAPPSEQEWAALMRPGQALKPGARVMFQHDDRRLYGEVLARQDRGRRTIRLSVDEGSVAEMIERIGHIPLPPYIAREDRPADHERYQTVFARHRGSIAAPTAGLHFTESILAALLAKGVQLAEVTLHVGYGTFKPVRVDDVEAHVVDPEPFVVTPETADALTRARRDRRRIVAVGTTTTRVLESLDISPDGAVVPASGETGTFIYPGHCFQLVTGLLTNFHLPRSSLLMLVSALAGRDHVLAAYRAAIVERYRFYSYGDAMLVVD